jgi:ATP-binding protein involved in chromosome partitioning
MEPAESEEGGLLPAQTAGISFISTAHFRQHAEPAMVRAPIANGIIEQFLHKVEWGALDVLIIDFPPGTGDIQLTLAQKGALSAALLVTTPQEVALLDVRKCIQMFKQLEIPLLGVVENMSYFIDPESGTRHTPFGSGGGKRLSKEWELPLLAEIPLDPALSKAGDEGVSIFDSEDVPSKVVFEELGQKVVEAIKALPSAAFSARLEDKSLVLNFGDGEEKMLSAPSLQRRCPCARCQGRGAVDPEVQPFGLEKVGRYALRVQFTSGCSQGLYPRRLLEELAQ